MGLRELLEGTLTEEEMEHLVTSFDIVGDVAIVKVPGELEERKGLIAEAVMEQHGNVNTVIRKVGERGGEYRTAEYEILEGDSTETVHKEHGCRYLLDPRKVYFSGRLGHERERILDLVGEGEEVVDMFAGVGPFSILIAKRSRAERVYAFEKNPRAFEYLERNVRMNGVEEKVEVFEGDVREELPRSGAMADRIVMNLPSGAEEFVGLALEHLEDGGIVHFYTFVNKEEIGEEGKEKVRNIFGGEGRKAEILEEEVCGHYNPAVERVCYDVRIRNI